MRFTLEMELGNDAAQMNHNASMAIAAVFLRSHNQTLGFVVDSSKGGKTVARWQLLADDAQAAPAVGCCCGATSTPAPTMPAVLAMPTASELAAWQQLGAMAAPGADDLHRAAVASMASVAGMAGLPTAGAGALSGSGVAAESPRENIADRITPTGSIAAAAGPTGSPRRRNLASRPTRSQLVATIVADYRANGKAAANATFDTARDLHNLTEVEAKDIAARVRIIVAPTDI